MLPAKSSDGFTHDLFRRWNIYHQNIQISLQPCRDLADGGQQLRLACLHTELYELQEVIGIFVEKRTDSRKLIYEDEQIEFDAVILLELHAEHDRSKLVHVLLLQKIQDALGLRRWNHFRLHWLFLNILAKIQLLLAFWYSRRAQNGGLKALVVTILLVSSLIFPLILNKTVIWKILFVIHNIWRVVLISRAL